jgi:Fe-S-cluster containining protein
MERNNYQILTEYLLDIQKVDSIEKMDALIEVLTTAAGEIYPNISCKTGCFTCCTGASMPTVYAREWQRIREFINNMPEEDRQAIYQKAKGMLERRGELLEFVDKVVQQTATLDELKQNTRKLIEDFKEESCPLHLNGKCSIYPVRPTKCRIFGYFSIVYENKVQMLSCASDTIKMQQHLAANKTSQIALPYWSQFENKLIKLAEDKSEPFNQSIIPIWLKNDIENGKINFNESTDL